MKKKNNFIALLCYTDHSYETIYFIQERVTRECLVSFVSFNRTMELLYSPSLEQKESTSKTIPLLINSASFQWELYTSPSQLFGGVWEKIEGVFLLGSSSSYTNGSIGGEATHTLSLEEIPSHSHEYTHLKIGSYGGGDATSLLGDRLNSETTQTGSVGSSSPHNNMPPYLSVNMWKRIE